LWLYFALLIIEGALRKWILPGLSDPLLLVRDPVAAAIIYFAVRDGYFPALRLTRGFTVLLAAFVLLGGLQLILGYFRSVPVMVFGLRTYFLHPPLIFIMAQVLDARSIRRLGVSTLILAMPIALLMVLQFQSAPHDWINLGVGKAGQQIQSALNKIRPPGPFSYITGPVWYFSFTLSFLLASYVGGDRIPAVLRWAAWAALLAAVAVSGSRALLVALVPVVLCALAAPVVRPRLFGGLLQGFLTLAIAAAVVWSFNVIREGVDVLNIRITTSGGSRELLQRSANSYLYARTAWTDAPLLGAGIGLGTNVGSTLAGRTGFQLGEDEWSRVIFEAGPVLGVAYLAWRFWLAVTLLRHAARAASVGYVLPLALFGACASNLAMGQWGQPSTQGFAVWVAGLCLAACRLSQAGRLREPAMAHSARGTRDWPVASGRVAVDNEEP
jgi:hypothetical protein